MKHGFVLSIYALMRANEKDSEGVATFKLEEVYSWAIYQVTKLAGDTDTNCAIVGAVIGAYVGID